MKGFLRKTLSVIVLSLGLVTTSACNLLTGELVDYVGQVKFSQTDWKTSDFLSTGLGAVTLKNSVDGDTAHFFSGQYNRVVEGRFNGINTPESTGVIEEWGKAASNYTKSVLSAAKTIVLETEREDGLKKPEADSTGDRYLVWVWTSERPIEEEDGTGLRLLNLDIVQKGYSVSSGNAGSKYQDYFLDADAQAQKHKLNIWSNEDDPDFYYGAATVTNMQAVFSDPAKWLDQKVYVEGVITRMQGTSAYMQDTFEQEDGTYKTYGAYIFTMYKSYEILKMGNRVGVIGTISQYYGSYQIVDVKYNKLLPSEDDMKLISTGNEVEPIELTVPEANKGNHMGILCRVNNLKVTGGYGGLNELDKNGQPNDDNAMTLYVEDSEGNKFNIRIDGDTHVKDKDGNRILSYNYFVDYCSQGEGYTFDIIGLMGRYTNQFTEITEIQLMLVGTSDLIYNTPENK